jgi:hypothetical protein
MSYPSVPALRRAPAAVGAPGRWTSAIGAGLEARVGVRAGKLSNVDFWQARTGELQRRQLRGLLKAARHTEFGRSRGFARLARLPLAEVVGAYREATPIAACASACVKGASPTSCGPGCVRDFAQTSGTTAGDKFIPVSRTCCGATSALPRHLRQPHPLRRLAARTLLGGKCLFLGGSSDLNQRPRHPHRRPLRHRHAADPLAPLRDLRSPARDRPHEPLADQDRGHGTRVHRSRHPHDQRHVLVGPRAL